MKRLLFIILLLFPTVALAAPSITGVTGTFSDGNQMVISGTEFGDTGPSIAVFDDFESGTNDNWVGNTTYNPPSLATVGSWYQKPNEYSACFYSNDYAHSGSLSMEGRSSGQYTAGVYTNQSPEMSTPLATNSHKVFASYWSYWPAGQEWPFDDYDPTPRVGLKQAWFHALQNHTGNDVMCYSMVGVYANIDQDASGACYIGGNNDGDFPVTSLGSKLTRGVWQRITYYWVGSTSGGGSYWIDQLNVGGTNTNVASDSGLTNQAFSDQPYTLVESGDWIRQSTAEGTEKYFYIDDFYAASGEGAQARVEIGDNPNYYSCTNLAICTVDSWSATSITATLRQGSFAAESSIYVFVVDADGNIDSDGPYILGGSSSPSSSVSGCGVSGSGVSSGGGG